MREGIILCLLMISVMGNAQEYFDLHVDNDLYFNTDWYYSSGIFIGTGKQRVKSNDGDKALKPQFVHWTLGQEIYNPKKRYSNDESTFDYPFGGWLFLERKLQTYIDSVSIFEWSVKFGVTGKASFAPYIQNLYHENVLGLKDLSWEKAVPQSTHLNISFQYRKRFNLTNQVSLLISGFSNLGTQRTGLGGRFGALIGTSKIISFTGNPLEAVGKAFAFYLGTRQEYRIHDYMVSGSLFNDDAPFVMSAIHYKNNIELGYVFHTERWKSFFLFNVVSKDVEKQNKNRHKYLSIGLTRYF